MILRAAWAAELLSTYIKLRWEDLPSQSSVAYQRVLCKESVTMTGVGIPSIFLLLLAMTSACLITNCPRGGKRNGARPPPRDTTEELPFCTLCGPAELGGLCFGPTMCCSPTGGCKVGGPHAAACLGIHTVPPLCRIPPQSLLLGMSLSQPASTETRSTSFATCGSGICAANGLCCTTDWCRADERCLSSAEQPPTANFVSDNNLSPNIRQEPQQTAFNDWHS